MTAKRDEGASEPRVSPQTGISNNKESPTVQQSDKGSVPDRETDFRNPPTGGLSLFETGFWGQIRYRPIISSDGPRSLGETAQGPDSPLNLLP